MSAEAVSHLAQAILASSAAALLIMALRKVLRIGVGARAAYWIWLLVPAAALVVLLPPPGEPAAALTSSAAGPVRAAAQAALAMIAQVAPPSRYATAVVALWLAGSLGSWLMILRRHAAFVRSLGEMIPQPDGSLRATRCAEPLLFGILHPRIVLPVDFDRSYDTNERAIVLAHEQAHWRRFDPQVNALAALWLSLSWFNPLMYLAYRLFRFDQELACDATVLAAPGATRRGYAQALVKTQLSVDLARHRTVLGCLWHSFHPLAERVQMLKHPLPSELRRRAGLGLMIACVLSGCYAVRTTQSRAVRHEADGPLIAVNIKAFIDGAEVISPTGSTSGWDVLVHSGGQFGIGNREHWANCTTQLAPGAGTNILLSCRLSRSETVFATPTLLVRDGEPASVDASDLKEGRTYRLEFNASSAPARIAAVSRATPQPGAAGVKTFVLKRVDSATDGPPGH